MPRASRESPAVLNKVIPARTRYFLNVTYDLAPGYVSSRAGRLRPSILFARGAEMDGRDARRSISTTLWLVQGLALHLYGFA